MCPAELLFALLSTVSITPHDAGTQLILKKHLAEMGFAIVDIPGEGGVENFWAELGTEGPLFVFAGHTDVVPAESAQWKYPPFTPTFEGDYLYGRGAQDMKGGLAAMIVATHHFLKERPHFRGRIGFLITSAEEGDHYMHGTPKVLAYLAQQNIKIDWCIVGEPSSHAVTGDRIRIGRRGSLHGDLVVKGVSGHVAYHHLAENPIHEFAPALEALVNAQWDNGTQDFPPSIFQITKIESGVAPNVIPSELKLHFNFRYSPALSLEKIDAQVRKILDDAKLKYTLTWNVSGEPFLTQRGELLSIVDSVVRQRMGYVPHHTTDGGTSDARFIAKTGAQVVELGLVNDRIHKVDERVKVSELDELADIYEALLIELLPAS